MSESERRDMFAAAALSGILASTMFVDHPYEPKQIVEEAFDWADLMSKKADEINRENERKRMEGGT